VVAVISVEDMPIPALQQHIFWASVLAGLLLWGPGRWSMDQVLWPRLRQRLFGASSMPASVTVARPSDSENRLSAP